MNPRIETTFPVGHATQNEVVQGFDARKLRAPFLLRFGALFIDYIFFLIIPATSIILGRLLGYDGRRLLDSELTNTGWLFGILLALTNLVIFPMFSGQSVGKMLTGIRIVSRDGKSPTFATILVRHLVGYPITLGSLGLGFFVSFFSTKGRALHDLIAGTVVIHGVPKRKFKNL